MSLYHPGLPVDHPCCAPDSFILLFVGHRGPGVKISAHFLPQWTLFCLVLLVEYFGCCHRTAWVCGDGWMSLRVAVVLPQDFQPQNSKLWWGALWVTLVVMVIWQAGWALCSTVGPAPLSLGKLVIQLSESWSVGTGNPSPLPSPLAFIPLFCHELLHSLLSIITIPHNRAELVTSAVRLVVSYWSNRNWIIADFNIFSLILWKVFFFFFNIVSVWNRIYLQL